MSLKEKCFSILKVFISSICHIFPLKNQIVLESFPDFADNTYFLYKKMIEKGYNKKYHIIWLLHKPYNGTPLPENVYTIEISGSFFKVVRFLWTTGRSKFIFDCNQYICKTDPRQKRIHLKHGLPMKEASVYNFEIGDIDLLSVPSEYWISECAKEHNISASLIKPLGFPRNDVLVPTKHDSVNIIWMPTYVSSASVQSNARSNLIKKMPFGLPSIDTAEQIKELNEVLKTYGANLYIRLHPAQDDSVISINEMTNIFLCNNEFLKNNNTTLYSFLCKTDALISDYSSIYYDYLKLDKPIALVTKFFNEYKEECGSMKFSYDEFMEKFPATFVNSYEELIDFFKAISERKDPDAENRRKIKEKYMPDSDTDSSENIIEYIKDNFNF